MTAALPAITLWQPWASLVACGAKPYEFRGRAAPRALWGSRVAIHAGARPVKRAEVQDLLLRLRRDGARGQHLRRAEAEALLEPLLAAPGMLPRSCVVCLATLGEPMDPSRVRARFDPDSDRAEHHNWAWPLLAVEPLLPPVPATGAQGWWRWSPPP